MPLLRALRAYLCGNVLHDGQLGVNADRALNLDLVVASKLLSHDALDLAFSVVAVEVPRRLPQRRTRPLRRLRLCRRLWRRLFFSTVLATDFVVPPLDRAGAAAGLHFPAGVRRANLGRSRRQPSAELSRVPPLRASGHGAAQGSAGFLDDFWKIAGGFLEDFW